MTIDLSTKILTNKYLIEIFNQDITESVQIQKDANASYINFALPANSIWWDILEEEANNCKQFEKYEEKRKARILASLYIVNQYTLQNGNNDSGESISIGHVSISGANIAVEGYNLAKKWLNNLCENELKGVHLTVINSNDYCQ